jgi:colanic acid/amylovoran biosynthesis glycosyltransferase
LSTNEHTIGNAQQLACSQSDRLLLVLPIQAFSEKDRIYVDRQACNGLRLWLENFQTVTLMCGVHQAKPPEDRSPLDEIEGSGRLKFVGLPVAYTPHKFLASLPKFVPVISREITGSQFLHFAIGGLWGDWAAVACLLAYRAKRPFAVWTDRVESQVVAFQANSKRGVRKLYSKCTAWLMKHYERYLTRRASIGLFHGMDCYEAYSKYSKNPNLVHDIHLDYKDLITERELETRLARSDPIKLVYAGRVHKDKGVFDWIEALALAASASIDFTAVWFGDGPEMVAARDLTKSLGLSHRIQFPGAINNHPELIEEIKTFDAFVFCHKTLESPRCLIEALICGLPLIGYDASFQRDLIKNHNGGLLTPINDTKKVAGSIAAFLKNRNILTYSARLDGSAFDATNVFRQRSALMRSI